MGLDKSQTEKLFGKPSSIENIGAYGSRWTYDKTNFSLEVNKKGKLTSVKILNNSTDLYPGGSDIAKIPSFDKIRKALSSPNNADILDVLSGDVKVYKDSNAYHFKKSFKTEQSTDYSKMISLIRELSKDLSAITKNTDEYEENMRMTLGEDVKHVIKIKKGHAIKEIVLKYYGGKYLIYKISASGK